MTIRELIEALQDYPEDAEVLALDENDYERGYDNALVSLFGLHNLTSDADGEDEMLTCNKESVCKFYAHLLDMVENERMSEHYPKWCDLESEYIALFGEKAFADYFRPDAEQAPTKPKFEVGDIVRIKSDAAEYHQGYQNGYAWLPERDIFVGKITAITNIRISGDIELKISGGNITWEAIDLEPYTEPKEGISPNVNHSDLNIDELVAKGHVPNPSIFFDGTFKDSSRNERRLNIAATIMGHIIQSGFYSLAENYREKNITEMAKLSMQITDVLLAECEKGGDE